MERHSRAGSVQMAQETIEQSLVYIVDDDE
jgi:hypothetical protein